MEDRDGLGRTWAAMNKQRPVYACMYAKEFPVQAMLRLHPELRDKAVVVMDGEPPLQQVYSLNGRAQRSGATHGMTKVEIETLSAITILSRSAAQEEAAHEVLLECAGTFSPRVEDCSNAGDFLCVMDISGTEKLWGPPRALAQSIAQRAQSLGVIVGVTVSSNFDAAISHAIGRPSVVAFIPPGAEGIALAPLPLKVLRLSEAHKETLALWGIRTLGELAALPEKELIARLGQEGKRLRLMARGELPHLFVPMEPLFRLEERLEFDSPVEVVESLLFVVAVMLEQLVLRATAQVLALASVTLTLALEGEAVHVRKVRPAIPSNDKQMWLKLIRLDMEVHSPSAAVVGIGLSAEHGAMSKVQMGLFSPELPEPLRLDVTLARIKAIVGEGYVGKAVLEDTHRVDAFRVEQFSIPGSYKAETILKDVEHGSAAMRILRPAQKIRMALYGERPAGFAFREQQYTVERVFGPWRISGEWWSASQWDAEQWDLIARAQDGQMLCCCAVRSSDGWSMVGLYD
jgi:protein ImuB